MLPGEKMTSKSLQNFFFFVLWKKKSYVGLEKWKVKMLDDLSL